MILSQQIPLCFAFAALKFRLDNIYIIFAEGIFTVGHAAKGTSSSYKVFQYLNICTLAPGLTALHILIPESDKEGDE